MNTGRTASTPTDTHSGDGSVTSTPGSDTTNTSGNNCRVEPKPLRTAIKLDKFDGTGDIDTFFTQFDIAVRYNAWSEEDKQSQLLTSVTGSAAQMLKNCKGALTYDNFREKLLDKYGSEGQETHYRR